MLGQLRNKDYNYFSDFFSSTESFFDSYQTLLDSEEVDGNKIFYMELPGVKKEDLKVTLDENLLKINATKKIGNRSSLYEKTIKFGKGFSLAEMQLKLEDGILQIIVPVTKQLSEKKEPRLLTVG